MKNPATAGVGLTRAAHRRTIAGFQKGGDMRRELTGRGNLRLPNGATWDGYYLINSGDDARLAAYGLFTPHGTSEPIFNVAHGDRMPASLTLDDGRTVSVTIMFTGAGAADVVAFAEDPFPPT